MANFFFSIALSVCLATVTSDNAISPLEYPVSKFVLSTHRLDVQNPDEPFSFNPSIAMLPNRNKTLLIFRIDKRRSDKLYDNKLGYTLLHQKTFAPLMQPMNAVMDNAERRILQKTSDARIFMLNESLYIIHSPYFHSNLLQILQLKLNEQNQLSAVENSILDLGYSAGNNTREKNWAPFQFHFKKTYHTVFFVHSIIPHRILHHTDLTNYHKASALPVVRDGKRRADMHSVFCTTLGLNQLPPFWTNWKSLHADTPAQLVRVGDSWKYLSFFHSRRDFLKLGRTSYAMGAYLFEATPPFAITHFSPSAIVGDTFYNVKEGNPYFCCHEYIVFPGSFYLRDGVVVLSYGRNDMEAWIVRMDKKMLIDSLVNVKSQFC